MILSKAILTTDYQTSGKKKKGNYSLYYSSVSTEGFNYSAIVWKELGSTVASALPKGFEVKRPSQHA